MVSDFCHHLCSVTCCCWNLTCTELPYNMCPCSFSYRDKLQPQSRVPLRDLPAKSSSKPTPAATSTSTSSSATAPGASSVIHSEQSDAVLLSNLTLTVTDKASLPTADTYDSISLADVTVPLETIKPSKHWNKKLASVFKVFVS